MVNARSGRRPGEASTREVILAAARAAFSEAGFEGATVRKIAARAAVDPALVLHYFGSKRALFVAASDLPIDPAALVPAVFAGGPSSAGERLLRTFLAAWDVAPVRDAFFGLIRAAMTDKEASDMLRHRLGTELLGRVAGHLDLDHAETRAALVGSQLVGLAIARYIVRLPALAEMDNEQVVAAVAPVIQRYLTEPLPFSPEVHS